MELSLLIVGLGLGYAIRALLAGRSNCLIIAVVAWFRTSGRTWLSFTRSQGKEGRLPHSAVMSEMGNLEVTDHGFLRDGSTLYVLQYVPERRKHRVLDVGDFPLFFDGMYCLEKFVRVGGGLSGTFEGAARELAKDAQLSEGSRAWR